jgi:histidinol-phosphatase (PHP family)
MKWPADYHMHTPLCRHATGEPGEYAARAIALGFTEIGFSDHAPMPQDDFDNWRMNADKLDEYVAKVQKARKEFPQLIIRLALEVDYLPGYEDWIRGLAARHPWDYFIGSVHYVADDWAIDDPQKLSEWKHRNADEVWAVYFERLTKAAESGFFEIIGHADLPKKFGHRPSRDPGCAGGFAEASCAPLYETFLNAAKENNCAIELNTAGLRKDCREIYPSLKILQLAFQKGVPITFGSDAHAPGEVGMDFGEAVQLARKAGFKNCLRFEQRRSKSISL